MKTNNNGLDTNDGNNQDQTERLQRRCAATDGDLIYSTELNPRDISTTVPKGVTIQGTALEELKFIHPTQSNDAFLLNSDVTIENLTLKDLFYDSGNDDGYAFRLVNNFNTGIENQEIGRSCKECPL